MRKGKETDRVRFKCPLWSRWFIFASCIETGFRFMSADVCTVRHSSVTPPHIPQKNTNEPNVRWGKKRQNTSQQAGKSMRRQTDGRTKTARREATSLTAIFNRPHFWSTQHWTETEKRHTKKQENKKVKSSELLSNIKTPQSMRLAQRMGVGACCWRYTSFIALCPTA